jgi:hypothetical protein
MHKNQGVSEKHCTYPNFKYNNYRITCYLTEIDQNRKMTQELEDYPFSKK